MRVVLALLAIFSVDCADEGGGVGEPSAGDSPTIGELGPLRSMAQGRDSRWAKPPDLDHPACRTRLPTPWCAPDVAAQAREDYELVFGWQEGRLAEDVKQTVSAHVTCWLALEGYASCSDEMCLVALFMTRDDNLFNLGVVYQDKPHEQFENPRWADAREWGPSFSFALEPLQWLGPHEQTRNAKPCGERRTDS